MEKPSVTQTYQEWLALGLICSGFAAFFLFMNAISPSFSDSPVMLWVAVGAIGAFAALCFLVAASSTTFDEHGICFKSPLFTKQFTWSDVKFVELRKDRSRNGSYVPLLTMDLKGWVPGWPISYTKRIMTCIRYYYGEPNIDTWGKPPTSF